MLSEILTHHEPAILQRWVEAQTTGNGFRPDRMSAADVRDSATSFLSALRRAGESGTNDLHSPAWKDVRDVLDSLSARRAEQGFSPSETAMFVLSLKEPIFQQLRESGGLVPAKLAEAIWETSTVLDKLGLYTTEIHQRSRDAIIVRQQREMLEVSTPVVTLWNGVLALPLIGTLDSARTQVVMESLLQRIVETGAPIAIIDITGVPTVDTLTAQHLLKTVAAARLMGGECIISGIRPQIAQTIVHLGVDLGTVVTKATLADAFAVALDQLGLAVRKAKRRGGPEA